MNNNDLEMATIHPEGVECLEWEGKDEASDVEGDEGDEVDPFDPTVNLNFEVDEEGNVVWPTATDTSSDGSVLVSLLLSLSSLFTLLLPRMWSRTITGEGATCSRWMRLLLFSRRWGRRMGRICCSPAGEGASACACA